MNISLCLSVAGIILLGVIAFTDGQSCKNSVLITDSRRSTKEVFDWQTDSPISDTDVDQSRWYRFQSYIGNSIPERPEGESVELNRCGTTYPMFISGVDQHPANDNETKIATVKASTWQGQISIHKCPSVEGAESFYIYNLVPAPADQTAYCAGEGQPCPEGLMFNGYECVDYYPIMKGPPIFSGPHTTGDAEEMEIYFTCTVQYDRVPNDTFARFFLTFLFDGFELANVGAPHQYLPSFTLGPVDGIPNIAVNLTEYYLQGRLGKDIRCKVRSFWLENGDKGPEMLSEDKYMATIKAVETFDFDLNKGADQRILFTPTLPFTYHHCSKKDCAYMPFVYFFPLNTDVATDHDCYVIWRNGTVIELAVNIMPFASSRIFEVKFKPYTADLLEERTSLWHNFIIPTVTINAFHSSEKLCKSISDPHMTTFDGRYFNSYETGEYYLVLADVVVDAVKYNLEVQVRQEKCNGNVACNCGVIVREINSVVKIMYNECGKWDSTTPRPISVARLLEQYPDDGTNVTGDGGRKFSIRMPSGTRVEVDVTVPWLSIEVHLAPIYHGKTSANSLCGNSNGNPGDDSDQSASCKIVEPAKNYFNEQPECYDHFFPAAMTCQCSDSAKILECTADEQNITIKSPANKKLSTMWSSGKICFDPASLFPDQHENNADYILDQADLYPPFISDPNAGQNLTLTWPTPKNKTKEEVEQYCMKMLTDSPVFSDCNTVANTDETMLNCVSDIQIADEYITTTSYADTFGQECVNVLIQQENNSTAGGTPPAVDISAIYSKICPAQCSGHGNCTDATCTCNEGFIGADCSVDETLPPVLTGIARSGLCDVQQRPCATVSVFGYSIVSTQTLKCRFSNMDGGPALDTNGTLITGSEVSCTVPITTTERPPIIRQGISVANDGALYSNVLEFVTFDSICMSCSTDKVCTQKTDSCLINDRCYASGAVKDIKTCKQCSPSQSSSSWTDKPVTDNLRTCSRTCDYGAQLNETICSINNAVIKTEPILCRTSSCTAIPEENLQGVIMTLSNEDTAKVLLTPTEILSQVAQVVNNYCSVHATQCCNSVGIPNGVSLSSFTSLELCPYGSGYPQLGDSSSRIKVIVKIIPSDIQNKCLQSAPQKSTVGEQDYADPEIIVTAVTEGKNVIEQALNITITSVEKDSGSNAATSLPLSKYTLILVTAVTAFMLSGLI